MNAPRLAVMCETAEQKEVVCAILEERIFQDRKFGPIVDMKSHSALRNRRRLGSGAHNLGEWVILIEDELAEAKRALIKGGVGRDALRSEIIQIAALCLASLEQHGLIDPHNGRQV